VWACSARMIAASAWGRVSLARARGAVTRARGSVPVVPVQALHGSQELLQHRRQPSSRATRRTPRGELEARRRGAARQALRQKLALLDGGKARVYFEQLAGRGMASPQLCGMMLDSCTQLEDVRWLYSVMSRHNLRPQAGLSSGMHSAWLRLSGDAGGSYAEAVGGVAELGAHVFDVTDRAFTLLLGMASLPSRLPVLLLARAWVGQSDLKAGVRG
jgi:hypothetical protein